RWIVRVPLDHLGREIDGRRGARADDLPLRDVEVTVRARSLVVLRPGVAADGPRRVSRRVPGHHDEQAAEVLGMEVLRIPEELPELPLERPVIVERLPALEDGALP